MKVLLKRPVASQSRGADGLTTAEEEEDDENEEYGERSEGRRWGNGMGQGVKDQPLIRRWQDAQVYALMFWI